MKKVKEMNGYTIFLVENLYSIARYHISLKWIVVNQRVWKNLSKEERKTIIDHEIKERKLVKQGVSVAKAHRESRTKQGRKIMEKIESLFP